MQSQRTEHEMPWKQFFISYRKHSISETHFSGLRNEDFLFNKQTKHMAEGTAFKPQKTQLQ